MSLPASKKLFVNFMVKLLLILAIIGGSIVLFFYNKENISYFKHKQERITNLIELNDVLQNVNYAYVAFVDGDSSQTDSLSAHVKVLTAKKKIFEQFIEDNYKNDIANIQDDLNEDIRLYTSQFGTPSFIEGQFGKRIDATYSSINQLIKKERDDLRVKTTQNDDFYEMLSYLVFGVGIVVMIMNVFLYVRSQKSLQKQLAHEKEIYNAKLAAQSANNAKSEYLAMISHEIRTPMNGVLGMSNLLLQGSLNDEQKDYAQTIHNSAESLLRIVNDVLDFSKIEAGKIQLDKTSVNIRELIAEVFSILPKSTEQLKFNYLVDQGVPQSIHCDSGRLKQVLLNLLSNASKFTERGSIILECKVIDSTDNGFLRLGFNVKDTGIGIAEERIKMLFKPFVQVDHTTVRKYGGTGLGLNIAYNLISMMDGKIKVSSQVGKGSTFTFFIVTKEMAENNKSKPEIQKEQKMLDNALSSNFPLKVLVVDDNEINLMLITKTLSKLGYECKRASNGQLALDLVKQEEFDLIFMDMQMPIMDGTVATTEIRKHYRVYEYPVVIALTANALGDGKDKCLEAGMQDFIAKPFKPAEIEEVIKKWAPKIISYKRKNQSISLS